MLSTRPSKSVGSDEIWHAATSALRSALDVKGWDYSVDEGGGAFYGPKIDLKIRDAIGRTWQCSTVQCDFNLPDRFGMEYVSSDGDRKQPIMLHRAIFGSIERFFGILVESTAGDLPLWLSPVQMKLLPVSDTAIEFCQGVIQKAKNYGIRVEIDRSNDRLAKQIRNAETSKIPNMVCCCDLIMPLIVKLFFWHETSNIIFITTTLPDSPMICTLCCSHEGDCRRS